MCPNRQMSLPADVLDDLDDALVALRRMFSHAGGAVDRERWPDIELSTVLVAHAVSRPRAQDQVVTVASIAESLGVARSTASRLVGRAANAGIVVTASAPHDARQVQLTLTERGHQLVQEARQFRRRMLRDRLSGVATDDARALLDLLRRLADGVP